VKVRQVVVSEGGMIRILTFRVIASLPLRRRLDIADTDPLFETDDLSPYCRLIGDI